MLTKTSSRTVRSGCKHCGSMSLYWAKDSETQKFVLVEADSHTRGSAKGCSIPYATVHKCRSEYAPTPGEPVDILPDDEFKPDVPDVSDPAPVSVPSTPNQPNGSGDVESALGTLMEALKGQSVNEDAVRSIVADELAKTDRPTRTVVIKDETIREVEGLTHRILADVIALASTGKPVLMVGPAGTGKSTIARQVADAFGFTQDQYGEISCDPQMSSSALFGYMDANGNYVRTVFRDRWEHGGMFHFDEFDNSHPSILAKINAALALSAGQTLAFPDGMIVRHTEFRAIASANTFGNGPDRIYVGRQQLDKATLDRFLVIEVDYDEALEQNACHATGVDPEKMHRILGLVRSLRKDAAKHKLPVIFGQRSSVYACVLAANDVRAELVMSAAIRRDVSDNDWNRLGAPSLSFS